jgi:hypothetical protein
MSSEPFCLTGTFQERKKMQKQIFRIALIVIVGAFALGACGGANATPTATPVIVEAIQTAAAQTVIAQLTQQAPTITPTPAFTNTPNVTATPTLAQPTQTKPAPTAANCANYLFISDVTIPDGTQMPAGQAFTKTWRVQNNGTCTWTTNFKLAFSFGEAMGGQAVPFASAVPTGQKVDISVDLKVPNKTGKLTGAWILVDDKGQHFGAILTVVINVGTASPTPPGSATVEPTKTNTPIPVSTSTDTPVPSETPTETPVPTT